LFYGAFLPDTQKEEYLKKRIILFVLILKVFKNLSIRDPQHGFADLFLKVPETLLFGPKPENATSSQRTAKAHSAEGRPYTFVVGKGGGFTRITGAG
jgi:hypothetical protein